MTAPCRGVLLALEEVPDPVFAGKAVGDGLAVDPLNPVLVAPCAGRVAQVHAAKHAVVIDTDTGAQILLHVGVDTVQLKGEGFFPRVKQGDRVVAGQSLIEFDADQVGRSAKSLVVVLVVTEPGPNRLKLRVGEAHRVVSPGDVLAELLPEGAATGAVASGTAEKAVSEPVQVRLATGMHARPAALLAAVAKKFQSRIEIRRGTQSANAKSVVGIMGLEIATAESVSFAAEGPDAATAVRELAGFLAQLDEKPEAHPASAPGAASGASAARAAGAPGTYAAVVASPGLAVGRVHQHQSEELVVREASLVSPREEQASLDAALTTASAELRELQRKSSIFDAHQGLIEDPDLIAEAVGLIETGKSAAFAWRQVTSGHAGRMAGLRNELMAQRAADLRDVGRRVLRILTGAAAPAPIGPASPRISNDSGIILIAENLTPSDIVQLDPAQVRGFATTTGGATSHIGIIARSLGLPALAGIEPRALEIANGTEIVLDGNRGELRLEPTAEEIREIEREQAADRDRRGQALKNSGRSASTSDGHAVEVAANIGGAEDARKAVEMGCDGVGLLRSEFLFLGRSTPPTEDEQLQTYQEIADILDGRPLTIRTLDVGGDKPLQYLPIPREENPFLGVRGIRVGLLHGNGILREQLRAILRVKSRGPVSVMFPMISLREELLEAKAILEEERRKLGAPAIRVGIMIEVPSAALLAERLAPEVDFFSIGTNDLTQYTLAMDRGHRDLAKLADGLHPSVLKLVEMTVQAARLHGKHVAVCGGIAGDAQAVPILLGLGVDELSVSVPSIPLVKAQVRELSIGTVRGLSLRALESRDARQVRDLEA